MDPKLLKKRPAAGVRSHAAEHHEDADHDEEEEEEAPRLTASTFDFSQGLRATRLLRMDENAPEDVILLLDAFSKGELDASSSWVLFEMLAENIGADDERVSSFFRNFSGSPVDSLFIKGRRFSLVAVSYGAEEDNAEALRCFNKGVELDDPSGRSHQMAGYCYKKGFGTIDDEPDLEKTIQLFTQASERGLAAAHEALGMMYMSGRGVKRNRKAAYELFMRSYKLGSPHGAACIAELSKKSDKKLAVALYKEAWASGHRAAGKVLQHMLRGGCALVVPFGEWQPLSHVHMFATAATKREIRCVLMLAKRNAPPFEALAPQCIRRLCFFLCTRPRMDEMAMRYSQSLGDSAGHHRRVKSLSRSGGADARNKKPRDSCALQ